MMIQEAEIQSSMRVTYPQARRSPRLSASLRPIEAGAGWREFHGDAAMLIQDVEIRTYEAGELLLSTTFTVIYSMQ